jgi:hypothetical protein
MPEQVIFWLLFNDKSLYYIIYLGKNGLGYILGDFFTDSSDDLSKNITNLVVSVHNVFLFKLARIKNVVFHIQSTQNTCILLLARKWRANIFAKVVRKNQKRLFAISRKMGTPVAGCFSNWSDLIRNFFSVHEIQFLLNGKTSLAFHGLYIYTTYTHTHTHTHTNTH